MTHESLTPKRTPYPLGPLNLSGSLNADGLLNANGSLNPHLSQNSNGPLNPPQDPLKLHGSLKPRESLKPLISWIVMGPWSPLCPWIQNWLLNPHRSISPWSPIGPWPNLILTIPPLVLMLDPWESFVKYVHSNIEWTSVSILAKIKNFNEVCSKKDLFSCHKKWQITQDHSRWAWNLRKISLYGHGTNSR